ncbi:MAG: TIGR03084 family protein, partial [Acidimicrobiia bacterium]|nr:TIGR03084 family protein [Acidimicrobiia bacterium]
MAVDIDALCDDLAAEGHELIALVADLDAAGWATPTPAAGWNVRDQVAHVARFDDAARLSIVDPAAFEASRPAPGGPLGIVDAAAERDRSLDGPAALDWLRRARTELVAAGRAADPGARVPWYGPDMTVASTLTARIMETWAHGQDVADALGVVRTPTDRLRHVAFICARAMPNSYRAHGRAVPDQPVRVELTAPSGATWAFGPEGAANVVRGPAVDLCLVATQRRHRNDTELVATGP